MSNEQTGRKRLRIGTRGSALALKQSAMTQAALAAQFPELELEEVIITTSGDRGAKPDERAGLKGLFTKEIEDALLSGRIDVAVHSLKDLPGQIPEALSLAAVLERAPTSDLLIIKRRPVVQIGTSSVRRSQLLKWMNPEWNPVEHRGNVPTRLEKLKASDTLDAVVLARAGIQRLEIDLAGYGFEVEDLATYPAIGQGAIGLEIRADDAETREILSRINHVPTFTCVRAERELLRLLDGDCKLPVGAKTTLDDHTLRLEAVLFTEGSAAPAVAAAEGASENPEAVATQVYEQLVQKQGAISQS